MCDDYLLQPGGCVGCIVLSRVWTEGKCWVHLTALRGDGWVGGELGASTGRLLNGDHLEQSARWTLYLTPRQTPFTGIVIISFIRAPAHNAAKHTAQDDGRHWLGTLERHNAAQQICQSVSSDRPHRRSYPDIKEAQGHHIGWGIYFMKAVPSAQDLDAEIK